MLKLVGCIIGTSQERLDKSSEQMRSHRVLAKARGAKVYMSLLKKIYLLMRALMMSRQRLEAEVEALRQQLAELRRTSSSRDSEGKGGHGRLRRYGGGILTYSCGNAARRSAYCAILHQPAELLPPHLFSIL